MSRNQAAMYCTLVAVLALGCMHAPYPGQLVLQHVPTVAALIAFPFLARRFPVTDVAAACWTIFLLMHIVAARYSYSFVPYDRWAQRLLGTDITKHFGFRRNHFDRLVHFSFGLVWVRPMWEVLVRYVRVPRKAAYYVAFEFVLATSLLYELVEWGVALVLDPADVEAYNGQQGDMWDAQKDMFCALCGATVAVAVLYLTRRKREEIVAG